jgi:hypothetical protein
MQRPLWYTQGIKRQMASCLDIMCNFSTSFQQYLNILCTHRTTLCRKTGKNYAVCAQQHGVYDSNRMLGLSEQHVQTRKFCATISFCLWTCCWMNLSILFKISTHTVKTTSTYCVSWVAMVLKWFNHALIIFTVHCWITLITKLRLSRHDARFCQQRMSKTSPHAIHKLSNMLCNEDSPSCATRGSTLLKQSCHYCVRITNMLSSSGYYDVKWCATHCSPPSCNMGAASKHDVEKPRMMSVQIC